MVLNAGLQFVRHVKSADGIEATFATNHLGHFALFDALAGQLNPRARIVVVSSGTHDPEKNTGLPSPRWLDPEFLAFPDRDTSRKFEGQDTEMEIGRRRYTTSKLCNVYFVQELARRIAARHVTVPEDVTVNAFDPGMMPGTGLARTYPAPMRWAWSYLLPLVLPILKRTLQSGNVHSPAESGESLAKLVWSPEVAKITGAYFEGRKQIRSSKESYDQERAATLWEFSVKLVKTKNPAKSQA
jgi:NAD(P)-dependent dehydrogenase (short-subunit alcohol dehydrogenase family)